jgi:hypothetical protein
VRVEWRIDRIKELGEAARPGKSDNMKKNLSFIGMETIAFIPVETIQTQCKTYEHNAAQSEEPPMDQAFHKHQFASV